MPLLKRETLLPMKLWAERYKTLIMTNLHNCTSNGEMIWHKSLTNEGMK